MDIMGANRKKSTLALKQILEWIDVPVVYYPGHVSNVEYNYKVN